MIRSYLLVLALIISLLSGNKICAQETPQPDYDIYAFGEGGQIKMLYDRRQRPQSVFLDGKVFIVYNGGGDKKATSRAATKPFVLTFDPETKAFSESILLGPGSKDHHYGPVVWADMDDHLHVLFGCHKTPGTHLISNRPSSIGHSINDWREGPQIASSISYPTFYRIFDHQELMYYRTAGHTSSWTYNISNNNGKDWITPTTAVTDLDIKGRFQWSSYHCTLPSKDGRYLHIVFTAYDDNKDDDPKRYYNERYKKAVSNEWKYNLYYLKVDLKTQDILNYKGKKMVTPIDLDQANQKCRIWNTEGRGAGVPPTIVLDENDHPAFLHVLSEETTEIHNYYFVRLVNGKWEKTVIAPSNHQWNSCHIQLDNQGVYHAYLVVGDQYLDTKWVEGKPKGDQFTKGRVNYSHAGGFMDKHGGGQIEEWVSFDQGQTWEVAGNLIPSNNQFSGWKFNNVQAVTHPDGSVVEGMLMFYGWKDKDTPRAKAFLAIKK